MDIKKCMGCHAAQIDEDNVKCLIAKTSYPKRCPYPNGNITEAFMIKKLEENFGSPIMFWATNGRRTKWP
jgi:hypothetical protein